jgi:prevent-host-death family protein
MIRASVSHTKNHLSSLLNEVKMGETVVITDRDRPIARIVPIGASEASDRIQELARLGLARLPIGPSLQPGDIKPIELENGGHAGVLDAILEERRNGR